MYAPWRIAALATLVIALPAQAQRHHRSSSDDRDSYEMRIDTTVTISKSGTVDVQAFSSDVIVTGWDRDQIKIHAVSKNPLRFDSSPSRVTLVESPEDRDGDYDDDDQDARFEISMPKSARLVVRTLSGDVKLGDVADLEAHTVSGELNVTNVASHATLETVSGDVTVVHVSAGVRVNTVSGDVHARSITGEVAAQSVSGEIVLDDVTSAYVRSETVSGDSRFSGPVDPKGRYEFHSHSGDVNIDLTGGGGDATLDLETYSGDLDTSCAITMQPSGDHGRGKRGTFTMGHGGGAHFSLKTFSGDVHITGCRSRGDN